jgi:FO synthase
LAIAGADIWAIIPVKKIADAKGRMAEFPDARRCSLALAMAEHTVDTLAQVRSIARILIVASDQDIAQRTNTPKTQVIADPGAGLNAAFAAGIATATAAGAGYLLLIHADFAALNAEEIQALLTDHVRRARDAIGLVCCKNGTGTNAVIAHADAMLWPQFGTNSFARHRAAAGKRYYAVNAPSLAHDIDIIDDITRLCATGTRLDSRVEAALSLNAGETRLSPADVRLEVADTPRAKPSGVRETITYSPKVFLPLTELCRDVCHYCTFAKSPRRARAPYMTVDQAIAVAAAGAQMGCKEALFTLGDRPELRYKVAADWLAKNGFASTLHYLAHVAGAVRDTTGLLPHINAGCMDAAELAMLRPVSASMGLMLESAAVRLCAKGGPHYGSPDKHPIARLATIAEAGRQHIPFTTGILVGIGETRTERLDALAQIHTLHLRYGHIQELIIQNFLPKLDTRMADVPAAPIEELCWSIAAARQMFGPEMSIQAPPNLNRDHLAALIEAGISDWGGVSPLTPDHVNPEAPWPEIAYLRAETEAAGKQLTARLTIYPAYIKAAERWIAPEMRRFVLEQTDGAGLAREDGWRAGRSTHAPSIMHTNLRSKHASAVGSLVRQIVDFGADDLGKGEIALLFTARGPDFQTVCEAADQLRVATSGDIATYVINRNINYTNICTYKCSFCAFSKGTRTHEGADKPYVLGVEEIANRTWEAQARGATEVCLQGGIHPQFSGETYLDIVRAVKTAAPAIHVHAFSPLEICHGARTLGLPLTDYLKLLRDAGLGSLPGTAAEILHDPVRAQICPDKLSTAAWLNVIETAHRVGLPTTSTIMFGHVDSYQDWATHLEALRNLQMRSVKAGAAAITEFVPLPFVAHEAPLFKRGLARPGPSFREAILMQAVARLVLAPWISNIQASWVKLGPGGMRFALQSGANDMGGVLMNESITRAAGAAHGQEMGVETMWDMAASLGRTPVQRSTLYRVVEPAHPHPVLGNARHSAYHRGHDEPTYQPQWR